MSFRAWAEIGILVTASGMLALDSCGESASRSDDWLPSFPHVAQVEGRRRISSGGVEAYDGGYATAIAVDPRRSGYFYLLTGRSHEAKNSRGELVSALAPAPQIGLFRLENDSLVRVVDISLRHADGSEFGGLSQARRDREDELPDSPHSGEIDGAGLVVLPDGTFWVSDARKPALVHFDRTGRQLERISASSGARRLPALLSGRWVDEGLQGLTIAKDGATLVTIARLAADQRQIAGRTSPLTRIVAFNTRTGVTRQYLYELGGPGTLAREIVAVSNTRYLVLERDREPRDSTRPSRQKRVYAIDLSGATDVSDESDSVDGYRVAGKTLESLSADEVRRSGVVPVRKTLIVDLLGIGSSHDAPEAMALIDEHTLAISSHDRGASLQGVMHADRRSEGKAVRHDRVYFVAIASALR